MNRVSTQEVVKSCGLEKEVEMIEAYKSENHFHFFPGTKDLGQIIVESTAVGIMEKISKLSCETQNTMMVFLTSFLPGLGDSIELFDEDGGGKARPVVIVRVKPKNEEIRLLITR